MISLTARLTNFPVSAFAVILGLSGFVIAVHKVEHTFHCGFYISPLFLAVDTALFVALTVIYTVKWFKAPTAVKADFTHPVRINFIPAFSISLLLLSIAFMPISAPLSKILWISGTLLHILLTLKVVGFWIRHEKINIKQMNPAWFIPVVGFIIIPVAGTAHFHPELSLPFFTIGLFFWLILSAIFFNRAFFHHPLTEKLLPTLFILIAPAAVASISLFRLTGEVTAFGKGLYYISLFFLLLMLSMHSLFSKIRFYLSWWAYTFPLSAVVISSLLLYNKTGQLPFAYIGGILFAGLTLLILTLFWKTATAVRRKEICIEEDV